MDGYYAYDTRCCENIPFSSYADAKFARLALTFNFPLTVLDSIIELFGDRNFRLEELSFRCAADVYIQTADYRERRARLRETGPQAVDVAQTSRSLGPGAMSMVTPNPAHRLILPLVIEHLIQDMEGEYTRMCRYGPLYKTLMNMSLVHRTWTIPSQVALGTLTSLDLGRDTHNAMSAPFVIGPWTRWLYVDYGIERIVQENKRPNVFHTIPCKLVEHASRARLVFERCKNLQRLFLNLCTSTENLHHSIFYDGFMDLRSFARLEELSIDTDSSTMLCFSLMSTVPNLQALRTLTVVFKCYTLDPPDESMSANADKLVPGPALENVTIFCDRRTMLGPHIPMLSWILRPREDRHIKSLVLGLPDPESISGPISSCLPLLHSLEIHASFSFSSVSVSNLLPLCPNLRNFSLCSRHADKINPDLLPKIRNSLVAPLKEIRLNTSSCDGKVIEGVCRCRFVRCSLYSNR